MTKHTSKNSQFFKQNFVLIPVHTKNQFYEQQSEDFEGAHYQSSGGKREGTKLMGHQSGSIRKVFNQDEWLYRQVKNMNSGANSASKFVDYAQIKRATRRHIS